MAKRRISKASKRRLSFFGTISIIVIFYFIFSLLYSIYNLYTLSIEKKNLESKYLQLQEKAEELKTDIEKLNDPNYLANYARENYLYSKDGEYIIQMQLDETNDNINEMSDDIEILSIQIKREYALMGLGGLVLLIFIYIIRRARKSKKNRN